MVTRKATPSGPSSGRRAAVSSGPDTSLAAENRKGGPPPPEGDEAVTRVELARRTGLATRTIGDHAAKGHLVNWGEKYLLWASIQSLIAYQAEALAGRAGEGQQARARLTMAKARTAELELARLEETLIDAEETRRWVEGMCLRVRNRILYVPKRLPMVLPHLTRADLAVIDAELREALTELGEGRADPDLSDTSSTEEPSDGV